METIISRVGGVRILKTFFKKLSIALTAITCLIFSFCEVLAVYLPNNYKITSSCNYNIKKLLNINVNNDSIVAPVLKENKTCCFDANISFMNIIPIKKVNIQKIEDAYVIPGGNPFGVKLFTKGVIIVGISEVKTDGGILNPAKQSGLQKGDIILNANQKEVNSNEDLIKIVEESNGEEIFAEVIRNGIKYETNIKPAKSANDNNYKLGIWVRDSSAGIGTITFWDEKTKIFAGLGHGICDIDTGELLPLSHGDIIKANINGISKGAKGNPGELKAYFIECEPIGVLIENSYSGVYGKINNKITSNEAIPVAMKQQVKQGKAQILTTIFASTPEYYDVEIVHINYNENLESKNMVIKITDDKLLSQTGGIIQGMSGSPIIQNGMLVGAITHVFINDPQKGYAIFAENMLSKVQNLNNADYKKIS